jgi:hypothetical protein
MKNLFYKYFSVVLLLCVTAVMTGCDGNAMDDPTLDMSGNDFITSFSINGQEGEIDNVAKTVTVWLEPGTDLTALQPEFTLSDGAVSNIPSGSTVDFTMPVVFKITNGNTYIDYTVTAKCYEASVLSLTLTDASGNKYEGVVNNDTHTIQVYVASDADLTRLSVSYSLSEGAEANITDGASVDFTSPVQFVVTGRGISTTYTINVTATDMPVTAFIGTAADVNGLKDEEKVAATWMLNNVPRSIYISMQDIISGAVKLDPSECKAIWWHCDDPSWPSQAWDSREAIKEYYANGGSLLLSRYACRYVNDVYQIAIDQKQPNAESKNDPAQILDAPLGFVVDKADHAIFNDMNAVKDMPIYLIDQGISTINCCVNWNIWDYADHSLEGWQNATGGVRLAYQADDANKTAIVEFPARTKTAGRVILIGTGGYEWNLTDDASNKYSVNRGQLTMNALRYLTGLTN